MSEYTKIEKETSNYTKSDKKGTEKGWFILGWFLDWFSKLGIYQKIEKSISTYTKVEH